jgi:3-deoxy-D-manno-octulosonic-acid transferase
MSECQKRQIAVVLVNGRLSPRSYKGYLRWRWFFAPVVARFAALAVQSEAERQRYQSLLGDRQMRIEVCGNIKLDGLKPANPAEIVQIRDKINLKAGELVLVAGSTHEGEESALLSALKELNYSFRLILVPRHPERFERVQQLIESYGMNARRFSRQEGFKAENDVYLLDTMGQLNKFYGLADIAFVGGTLADIGGHNLAEPCAYKAAVICGPHIHKTKEMHAKLVEREALLMVHNEKELMETVKLLAESPGKRDQLANNGNHFLLENQGALAKTLALLEEYLQTSAANPESKKETVGGVGR